MACDCPKKKTQQLQQYSRPSFQKGYPQQRPPYQQGFQKKPFQQRGFRKSNKPFKPRQFQACTAWIEEVDQGQDQEEYQDFDLQPEEEDVNDLAA